METILDKIIRQIRIDESDNIKNFNPENYAIQQRKPPIDILPIIQNNFFVIAEAKKGSPSKGIIREDFDPAAIAQSYEKAGASAISVLTEKNFFYGSKQNLSDIREKVNLPLLRKDFIFHPFQVYEAFNLGADFILLIVAALEYPVLKKLYDTALELKMNTLIEVHNEEELEVALRLGAPLIGINNRDLKTFEVDIHNSFVLKKRIPDNKFVISESGIKSSDDIKKLKAAGFAGVLIGESLLRQNDLQKAFKNIMGQEDIEQ